MSNHKELDSEASNSSSGSNGNQIKLKKEINLFTGCAIIIGNIVGSGIFITSKGVLEKSISPGLALIVWLVSGIFSLIGAYCYTELGTLIQTSGGDYAYINQSYGRLGAFLYNFMMTFVTIPCLNAISGITVATYIIRLIYVDCDPPLLLIRIISALTILFLCFLNMSNIKLVSKIQAAFTVTKMAALLLIIFMGFYTFIIGPIKTDELLQSWFDFKDVKLNGLAMAFYNGLYSFSGWNCLNFLTEELKSPSKNLPRAIMISMPLITLFYLVTNIAYMLVLTPSEIVSSDAVALTFSEKTLGSFAWLTPLFISFSTFGALSSCILSSSRIYYAAARDGNLPQCFALISLKNFTPVTCIVLQAIMSLMMLLVKDLDTLIMYGTFSELFFIAVALSSIFYFRYSIPNAPRPIKVNLAFPIIFMLNCVFLLALTLHQNPVETVIGLLIIMTGIPLYWIGVKWKKPESFNKKMNNLTIFCQKLFLSVKED